MIFISYSWVDQPIARSIEATIARMNLAYWIDRNDLDLGFCLKTQIFSAIERSALVLYITSEASKQSSWVNFERKTAAVLGKRSLLIEASHGFHEHHNYSQIEKQVLLNCIRT
ncbi:hypothetical protein DS901_18100 [Loktanella sp. D2R18]|uniref:toll/interleukin-1 receptor domain-containing protein n=1 Tax=Rhodobacterales TaxID=204455 RepID=UPI000DEB3F6C|nr:hypothetical protein DS901_18100 [Loktanella sp. D2R18]